jgi:hypothetical protein
MTAPDRAVAAILATRTGQDFTTAGSYDRARWRPCPTCRAWTLVGLDDHVAGIPVRVDPGPLTRSDEAAVLLDGRATFALIPDGTRLRIRRRDRWQIAGTPADRTHAVAEHSCHDYRPAPAPQRQEPAGDRPAF